MIIGSILKCKICGKEIAPPEILIGETPDARDGRTINKLLTHLQKRAEMESKSPTGGPHHHAIATAARACMHISGNLNGAILTGNFELPEDLEAQRQSLLRQVHEMTRTVRMSDDDLRAMLAAYTNGSDRYPTSLAFIQDLRDRYEGLGKYAPVVPVQPEVVKQ